MIDALIFYIIEKSRRGVAQLVAHVVWDHGAAGSSPVTPTINNYVRPIGQAVKTPPFHGGYRGSNPLWVTTLEPEIRDLDTNILRIASGFWYPVSGMGA